MIQYEIKKNGEIICTAAVDEFDQLEVALAKLIGDDISILNVTAFIPSCAESNDYISWETRKVEIGDEITISTKEIPTESAPFIDGEHDEEEDENPESEIYCSFCGKGNLEIDQMVSGDEAFICNECIELCSDIVKSEET